MATVVEGELYTGLDGQLSEIKRQLRQKGGYPFDPKQLKRALQLIIEGKFSELGVKFPCQVYVPELIPDKWEVLEDVEPTENLDVSKLKFEPFLKDGEEYIGGDEMRKRAVTLKANFGLSDVPSFLAQSDKIPAELRGKYIILPATVLRNPGGDRRVAYLYWDGSRWVLNFNWLDNDFNGNDRFARS